MKKIIVSLAILVSAAFFCRAGNDRWPNGNIVPEWFADTTRVDVNSLGSRYVITDYGVVRDSILVQTEAIQRVIDMAASDGGGVVVIPAGTFLSGSLFFRQGTHLLLEEGAVLKGVDDIRHYPIVSTRLEGQTLDYFAALVNADGLDGFTITGTGTIDGNGRRFWEEFWLRRRVNPDCTNLEALRPRLVYLSHCSNVCVQDVRLINSAFWTNHLYQCDHVRYLGCYIYAPTEGSKTPFIYNTTYDLAEPGNNFSFTTEDTNPNIAAPAFDPSSPVPAPSSDAIDIDCCHDILISGCYMNVNDDAVVLKGGKGTFADLDPDNGPNYNIIVQNCRYGRVYGCLTLGSESLHDWNVILRNVTFESADRVLWLKMRPDTPQLYEQVRVENVSGTCGSFLVIRPWTQFYNLLPREDMPLSACRDISFTGINAVCTTFFDVAPSDKYSLADFTFENCNIVERPAASDSLSSDDFSGLPPSSGFSFNMDIIENTIVSNLIINGKRVE